MPITKTKLPQVENMDSGIEDGLTNAATPSSSNPFVTSNSLAFIPVTHPNLPDSGNTEAGQGVADASPVSVLLPLSGFVGVGYDETKVRGFFLKVRIASDQENFTIQMRYPDGTLKTIAVIDAVVGGDDRHQENAVFVPVVSGQANVDLEFTKSGTSGSGSSSVTFYGAWQVG